MNEQVNILIEILINMSNFIEDLIEPDTYDDTKFNSSLKRLQFIQNDNNINIITNITKTTKNTIWRLKILIISWTNIFKVRQNGLARGRRPGPRGREPGLEGFSGG